MDHHRYKLGDPFDKAVNVGPVISRGAQKSVNAQIQDALAKGAINATPANPTFVNPPAEGNYVIPTILANTNHNMVVMKEETFGPVLPVMKVASDEEAVKWMNDSDYGLTASVWTKDLAAGRKLLKQLEAGTVFINRCDYPNPVSYILIRLSPIYTKYSCLGPCVDGLEEFRHGTFSWSLRL